MSLIPLGLSRLLQFYLSGPLPCPYLPDRVERKLFTRLTGDASMDAEINSTLTRAGFRRSHDIVYRPACQDCTACTPVRIPVASFAPDRNLRKIAARNRDLELSLGPMQVTDEIFALFSSYQKTRHPDSEMALMSQKDLSAMMQEGQVATGLYQLRARDGTLMGAMIADHVHDGLSAVYSFYRAGEARRSLGMQLILSLVDIAAANGLSYVYLGYWIEQSRKMSYKSRFRPLQALGPHGWAGMD